MIQNDYTELGAAPECLPRMTLISLISTDLHRSRNLSLAIIERDATGKFYAGEVETRYTLLMQSIPKVFFCVLCLGFAVTAYLAAGQGQPAPASPQAPSVDLAALVKQQFGSTFTLPAKFPTPIITADFDGDGVEDAVIVASSTEPFPDSVAFKYRISDPYNAYFGMGNPAISSKFGTSDPKRDHDLLIILGAGPDAWRSANPKEKFVIINLPFDDISVGRLLIKKNKLPVFVIKARESELMDSAVWYDVKKKRWKWEPGNTGTL